MLKRKREGWVWYASRSERPVHLDANHYPLIEFDGNQLPRPAWICQAENGGLHVDARVGRIDVHVTAPPIASMEINWTEPYALNLVAKSWAHLWRESIDPNSIFLGSLFLNGREIEDWVSLHGIRQPALKSRRMTERLCSRCGNLSTWTHGDEYFDDPHIGDQMVLVNGSGVYLRDDLVRKCHIGPPAGSFEPSYVAWRPQD
jgi:hypothetical protein